MNAEEARAKSYEARQRRDEEEARERRDADAQLVKEVRRRERRLRADVVPGIRALADKEIAGAVKLGARHAEVRLDPPKGATVGTLAARDWECAVSLLRRDLEAEGYEAAPLKYDSRVLVVRWEAAPSSSGYNHATGYDGPMGNTD